VDIGARARGKARALFLFLLRGYECVKLLDAVDRFEFADQLRDIAILDFNVTSNAINYAKFRSRSHDAVIRVYDEAGNVIETHEHAGDFKEW
jgi:hypothetical protein